MLGPAVGLVGELSTKIISNARNKNCLSLSGYQLIQDIIEPRDKKNSRENRNLFKAPREIGLIIVCYDPNRSKCRFLEN